MKKILSNTWVRLGIVLVIVLFVVAYIVGLILQFSDGYNAYLQSSDSGFFNDGNMFSDIAITFSPFANYAYLFSNQYALPLVLVLFFLISGFFVRFFSQFFGKGTKDKKRGFSFAKGGTYGTAGWMSQEELADVANVDSWKSAEGYILGQLDETCTKLINTKPRGRLNNHVAVFGASGSGKTRGFVKSYIIQSVKRNESIILTDPKGELFQDTAQFFRDNGYVVKIFNLVNPEKSDSWNCLKEIKGSEIMAQVFADTVIKNTIIGGKSDHFWDNSEMNLLKALILRVERGKDFKNFNQQNMGTVYDLLTKAVGEIGLDDLFNPRNLSDEEKCCLTPYNIFKQSAENVRGGIVLGLGTRIQVFQNEIIKKITAYDDIDLTLPGQRPCAYFCVMSDQDSTLNFLSSLFFSFLFIDLVRYADLNGGKCDVPVNFVLDEFPNIGQIVDFTKKLSTVRSRDINISIIFQAISQLQNRYPYGLWQEILGNCDTHLFLGCNDPDTAKFISDRAGEVTIKVSTSQVKRSTKLSPVIEKGYRESSGEGKRKLLTMDEVLRTPLNECLIFFRGQKALRAYKYYYDYHPHSKKFTPTYIKDYPSILEREHLLRAQQQNNNAQQSAPPDKPHSNTSMGEPVLQGAFTPLAQTKGTEKIVEPFSDIDKLKLELGAVSQPTKEKPKKNIFFNKCQQVVQQGPQSNTPTPESATTTEEVASFPIAQDADMTETPNTNETFVSAPVDVASEEIILEGYVVDDNIMELPEDICIIEPPLNIEINKIEEKKKEEDTDCDLVLETNANVPEGYVVVDEAPEQPEKKFVNKEVEKNLYTQFDKTEKVLHNVNIDIDYQDKPQTNNTQAQEVKAKHKSHKNNKATNKKIDPVFDDSFFFTVAKTWKPGDVSRRTREKLEKQRADLEGIDSK